MILCDREFEWALDQKHILILPRPDPKFMNSTTIDLRLVSQVRIGLPH